MATIFKTFVKVPNHTGLAEVADRMTKDLQARCRGCGLTLVTDRNVSWVTVEGLGFITLKPHLHRGAVESLAKLWDTETVMIGAQTTASCGVYAHYLEGTLVRFLSAGDGVWLEIYGQPESWEASLLKPELNNNYALREETTFSDTTVFDIAEKLGCPNPSSSASKEFIQ